MALPVGTGSAERRDQIVRMLTASPDGLSDAALARALGGPDAGVRTQTINQLCRRMVAEGRLERVGTRPILNRLVPPPKPARRRRTKNGTGTRSTAAPTPEPAPAPDPTADVPPPAPDPPVPEPVPAPDPALETIGNVEPSEAPSGVVEDAPGPVGTPSVDGAAPPVPVRDALQAWSRVVNVQAAVADWLARRGATIRWATMDGQGPARDLVVSLDGDELHVEVTGWPPDGARTHPTTIAGDWFHAAEHAATERRRTHPGARIVIALPDTRRYRALSRDRAEVLDDARAEVWFVDPAGVVHAP